MRRSIWTSLLVALLLGAAGVGGQQPQNAPHAGYVYPAGGQQGSTCQVIVGGQFLDGASSVIVSGPGVHARVVDINKPLTAKEITDLRDRMQALQQSGNTPAIQKQLADLRQQLGDSLRRNQSPVLSEYTTLDVSIAADAAPGVRQLRVSSPLGISNPVLFAVGQLPEFREKDVKTAPADTELAITIPAVVNGRLIPGDRDRLAFPLRQSPQYMPGDVDRYRFHAVRGQQLVVEVSARELMPFLADAVPGWLQATVAILDDNGREVAYADDYRFHPDPVLHYAVPADGDYVVEIKDALYRGREDFVYRIAIGELPFVTSIFPMGGPAGTQTRVDVSGWNLGSTTATMNAADAVAGVYPIAVRGGGLISNGVPFAVDTLPEVTEHESNNGIKDAQPLTLPVIVNGRIGQPGDADVYRFAGRAGEPIVAEVTAHRLDSPVDSTIELLDAAGRRVAFNDDQGDKGAALETHHADSLILTTLPASGVYFLRIADAERKGGPEHGYRLRISAPRPDFDLRVSPSSVNAGAGATVPLGVLALRRDGFDGDITVALRGAPAGFALSGAVVPAGQDQIRLTLTMPPAVLRDPVSVRVEGRATIGGREIVREALPADDMMQAFAYRHFVPADDLRASVLGRGAIRAQARLLTPAPLRIPAGGETRVRVGLPPAYQTFEKLEVDLSDPPEGLTIRAVSVTQNVAEFVVQASATVKPGLRGNLIATISGERVPPANAQGTQAARRRVPIGTLPALTFEIVR